ncbi:MAG TPA: LLM class flavin-dependent oxidoreductase [Gammaproteobacteria bacterium]|nr:LLM class flavin-dependent oxidoreductase [Gammaproteobacteria bacterium]
MRFGLLYSFITPADGSVSHQATFREMDTLLPLAESLGFDSFQTTEHHFQHNGWAPSPLVVLAHASGLTRRLRLVTNVLLLPLYDPLRLVEDVATLDNLSNGRLTLGVSPGYVSEELSAFGIPYAERFARSEEILDILEAAWRDEALEHEGRYYRIPRRRIVPRPVQAAIPIWYGVSGPKLLSRAARRRCPVTASPRHTNAELKEHYARYDAAAAAVGYATRERPIIRELFVAPTNEEAERLAGPAIVELFGLYSRKSVEGERQLRNDRGELVTTGEMLDFRSFASRYVVGDPARVQAELEVLIQALAPTEIICRMQLPGVPTAALERSIRLFGEQVIPALRGA